MTLAICDAVHTFWFETTPQEKWFKGGEAFDNELKGLWLDHYHAALDGEFLSWRHEARGALALCLLWDQFPRNAFRNTPRAFATDALALEVTCEAIEKNLDTELSTTERLFLYLPLMHSERLDNQARSVSLFSSLGVDMSLNYAVQHAKVIDMFGRFPGRNKALGRNTTEAEAAFLASEEGQRF